MAPRRPPKHGQQGETKISALEAGRRLRRGLAWASDADQAGLPSSPGPRPLESSRWTGPGATARVPLPARPPETKRGPGRTVLSRTSPSPRRRPREGARVGGQQADPLKAGILLGVRASQAAFTDLRGTGSGGLRPAGIWRLASPQPGPVQPPPTALSRLLAVEGGPLTRRPAARALLTLGTSGGTRGSFHVVVRLLWSTKKGQPVCGSILISQPGGRGSRSPAPLPDAICTMGEWVAALMLGRGRPRGAAAGVPDRGVPGHGVAGCRTSRCRVARWPRPELESCAPPTCPGSRRRAPL